MQKMGKISMARLFMLFAIASVNLLVPFSIASKHPILKFGYLKSNSVLMRKEMGQNGSPASPMERERTALRIKRRRNIECEFMKATRHSRIDSVYKS